MAELAGFSGIQVHYQPLGNPYNGFFGISIQKASNFVINVITDDGKRVNNATLEISYTHNSVLTKEVISYNPDVLYERTFPINTPISIKMYGAGYLKKELAAFTIAANEFKRVDIDLNYAAINVRRYILIV